MDLKLKDEPIFLIAITCLVPPIGLFILNRSERSVKFKWLAGVFSCIIFCGLLSLAFLGQQKSIDPAEFQLCVTRETLSVGQSGGLLIANGNQYCTAYTATVNNDVLKINKNLYTAQKPGSCTITVKFGEETRTAKIDVLDGSGTDSVVLASPSGERYHLKDSNHAGKKAIKMTEEDALQSGKTPCKNCFK